MKKEALIRLMEKYLAGEATAGEASALIRFLANRRRHSPRHQADWPFPDREEYKKAMLAAIMARAETEGAIKPLRRGLSARRWWYAAAVLALAVATLTLALWHGAPRQAPAQKWATKATLRGQKLTVKLPDGTVAKLNAESAIAYPIDFTAFAERRVTLRGEAFFEVAHDKHKPFRVAADSVVATALGTSFNVKAYPEDPAIRVTVATGRVGLAPSMPAVATPASTVLLAPGQQGVYDRRSARISQSAVGLEATLAWKDNVIRFDRVPLAEAAKLLARWYDVDIRLANPGTGQCLIEGHYHDESLANILESLRFSGGLAYAFIDKKHIEISGNACNNEDI